MNLLTSELSPIARGQLGTEGHQALLVGAIPAYPQPTVVLGLTRVLVVGAIPACVGPTRTRRWPQERFRSHPHMRGADYETVPVLRWMTGLYPRARGRHRQAADASLHPGVIPA
jgi:hypothetical protein